MSDNKSRRTTEQFKLFHVQPQLRGQTLAAALKHWQSDSSWGAIQNWIKARHVQVNGNLCVDAARRLTEKDVVKLWAEPLAKPVTASQLKLPYVDEHLLVVEKPAGITSVWHHEERSLSARRKQLQPTLEGLLPEVLDRIIGPPRLPHQASRRSDRAARQPARWPIYAVHRLDRDTSGLMIFARTRIAEQKLIGMFRDHLVQRQYWAVAIGHVESQTIRTTLVRDRGDGLRGSRSTVETQTEGASSDKDEGQLAVTHVELVERVGNYSIIRCKLETGRTHQIRIHLSELGHPLCGDKTYVKLPSGTIVPDDSRAPRQVLHAERLSFVHPLTGERPCVSDAARARIEELAEALAE